MPLQGQRSNATKAATSPKTPSPKTRLVGFTASFAGCTLGALLGVVSAYAGGRVDLFLERLVDILLASRS